MAENLLLLYDRPLEPCFLPKGPEKKSFIVPHEYMTARYKALPEQVVNDIADYYTNDKIPVKQISIPDSAKFREILSFPREASFSLFIPKHREIAGYLIATFTGMVTFEDLLAMAVYTRDRINPYLFNYGLSVAIIHRPDTQHLELPAFIQSFPYKFLDGKVLQKASEELGVVPDSYKMPIEVPRHYTATDLEEEQRLAYFREDIGINSHHWYWHLVYPYSGKEANKDRRGELFFYMHQQVIARYNFERLCNSLNRVLPWSDWKTPIKEAYFPKLDSQVAARVWPARMENQLIKNLNRDNINMAVSDLIQWNDRIIEAIDRNQVRTKDGLMELTEETGIDVLGNMVESSVLSPDRNFYGDLHNMGHAFISLAHDPDNRYLEDSAVMGDTATAMRDPVFYRWHSYIDGLFQRHKNKLNPYTKQQLEFKDIKMNDVFVEAPNGVKNNLYTFWQKSDLQLSRGLDFRKWGSVYARFTHLQHQPFTYNITVTNDTGGERMGTCRIFLAPQQDERKVDFVFRDQRTMFIELDRFTVALKQGPNTIKRHSKESSVTIPFHKTFDNETISSITQSARSDYCRCGWPEHMLIPKGTEGGMRCQLFVMISDYELDKVGETTSSNECKDAMSYCGVKDRKYPDKRAMGYPFDRPSTSTTLNSFLTSNMIVVSCKIFFNDRVVQPHKQPL
ncbi:phenoloxidase 1-like [Onthophagus taurus]|uniref:phenoloxidase 1-like n=1 Tax=Onthophagus taurus TaxID=166361 RepID=UPI0039BE4D9E